MRRLGSLFGFIVVVSAQILLVSSVQAQQAPPPIIYQPDPDSPTGERNSKAASQLSEFDFVIGDWDAEITWQAAGRPPLTDTAHWHNHWVVNGQVVMQEWRGPYITGAELRAYDPNLGKWTGRNVYPGGPEPWHNTTAEFVDGKMVVIIEGVKDERGAYLNRETYYEIAADSFKMKSDRSYDGGKTWEKGAYQMTCTRRAD